MNQLFIIKDRTDAGIRKPFVKICKTEAGAQRGVAAMQSKLPDYAKKLVSYEVVIVPDYDANKNSVYVLYDKTDRNFNKPFVDMVFDYSLANTKLAELRRGVPAHAHKLIYVRAEQLDA